MCACVCVRAYRFMTVFSMCGGAIIKVLYCLSLCASIVYNISMLYLQVTKALVMRSHTCGRDAAIKVCVTWLTSLYN